MKVSTLVKVKPSAVVEVSRLLTILRTVSPDAPLTESPGFNVVLSAPLRAPLTIDSPVEVVTIVSILVVSGRILQKDMYLIQIVNLTIYFVIFVITHN